MSDNISIGLTYLSPVGNHGRHNTQVLGGVSQLWPDFFARALAERPGMAQEQDPPSPALHDQDTGEPLGGTQALTLIKTQRMCQVLDREVRPAEPLFLPKAEFEAELLEPLPEPFDAAELIAQQRQLDLDISWRRPVVMGQGQALPQPGPAPEPRPLPLPIAEFELELLDKAPEPFDEATLAHQQADMRFDLHWARPVVLNNLRACA
ncbi:energy transducer TonB [Pseudomonas fulva]|nr:energy transducer TonB [Pseudomonas fulva]MBF8779811.1 energy transducer TonB [Pseudomonas fulva]